MSGNASGLTNTQQAFLVALAATLSSLGTLTTITGIINNAQITEIIGIVVIVAGIIAFFIKEYLGALGIEVPK